MKKTLRLGNIQQNIDNKYENIGKITIILDDKNREVALLSIGNIKYSAFLNKPLTEEQKAELNEKRKQMLQENNNINQENDNL